jgi:hypothetical protein
MLRRGGLKETGEATRTINLAFASVQGLIEAAPHSVRKKIGVKGKRHEASAIHGEGRSRPFGASLAGAKPQPKPVVRKSKGALGPVFTSCMLATKFVGSY